MKIVLALLLVAACGKKPAATGTGSSTPIPTPTTTTTTTTSTTTSASAASNAYAQAVLLTCVQPAKDVPGNEGSSWYMHCPACDTLDGAVWGTDLYTDDSSICAASVHAGIMTKAGGTVLVTWTPGEKTYIGSKRNGIETQDYNSWGRSFFVQSVDANGKPTSPAIAPTPAGTLKLSCAMHVDALGATVGATVHALCPPGCTTGNVWGTDVYTGDSALCVAAVHAGAATAAGGPITVTLGGPKDTFAGSARNGVTTQAYEHYDTSFTVGK